MWISAQSVTQYHGPGYCMDQVWIYIVFVILLMKCIFEAENAVGSAGGAGGAGSAGHSLTQEIVKTFDNILSETVLVNRIF